MSETCGLCGRCFDKESLRKHEPFCRSLHQQINSDHSSQLVTDEIKQQTKTVSEICRNGIVQQISNDSTKWFPRTVVLHQQFSGKQKKEQKKEKCEICGMWFVKGGSFEMHKRYCRKISPSQVQKRENIVFKTKGDTPEISMGRIVQQTKTVSPELGRDGIAQQTKPVTPNISRDGIAHETKPETPDINWHVAEPKSGLFRQNRDS